jgi:hypothetical protein
MSKQHPSHLRECTRHHKLGQYLRNKDEREAYRNDTFCTFPDIAGDQYVSNNIHNSEPIPDEVFEDVHRRWLAGEGKDL